MWLAEATVKTSGVNWESIAVIATAVLAIFGAFTSWIGRQITHAINDLSDKLLSRLETKETVNSIERRVTVLEVHERDREATA